MKKVTNSWASDHHLRIIIKFGINGSRQALHSLLKGISHFKLIEMQQYHFIVSDTLGTKYEAIISIEQFCDDFCIFKEIIKQQEGQIFLQHKMLIL